MAETKCDVQGCDNPAEEIFETRTGSNADGILMQWAVCKFHRAALDAGESWSASEDRSELLLGADAPLEVVDLQVLETAIGAPLITLMLGHDKIEQQRVSFTMDNDTLQSMCFWVTGHAHPESGDPFQKVT